MCFHPRVVALAEVDRRLHIERIAGRFQHIVDCPGQGRAPVERTLRPFDDFNPLKGGQWNRCVPLLDDDTVHKQAGVGTAEDIGLASDDGTKVVPPKGLGEIESGGRVRDVLQGRDSALFNGSLGECVHSCGNVAKVLFDLSGGDDYFLDRRFLGKRGSTSKRTEDKGKEGSEKHRTPHNEGPLGKCDRNRI